MWREPLKALAAAQAEALFDATVLQGQPFGEAAVAARAETRTAIERLRPELQPGLDDVARGLERLRTEAARLPQSYREFAEQIYPDRLQAFRSTLARASGFFDPRLRHAPQRLLRQRAETVLDAPADPFDKHRRIAAYEHTLETAARDADENARYQALLRLEQQVLSDRPAAHDFARFTKRQVESRLSEPAEAGNGGDIDRESLADLEARSRLCWRPTAWRSRGC